MGAQISPMLAVSDGSSAIEFYERAFGAEELWRIGEAAAVAGLSINGAHFFPRAGVATQRNALAGLDGLYDGEDRIVR